MSRNPASPKKTYSRIARILLVLLLIGVFFLALRFISHRLGFSDMTVEGLRALVEKTGGYGVLVFILVSFLQVTFVPIPSTVTILSGALLFGPIASFFYSLIGIFLGSFFAFFLGRVVGRPFVYFAAGGRETVDYYLGKANGREFVTFFFMFLLPAFPDDLLCAVAGITTIKPSQFALIQLISRPIATAATLIFMTGTLIPYHGWWLLLWGAIILLSLAAFILAFKNADAITAFFDGALDKIAKRFPKKTNTDKESVMPDSIQKITSFCVDHTTLTEGMYVSRVDGDITTFDLRTRRPNMGDYMDNATMHSLEHLFATYIRNSAIGDKVIYFGPMGCQTGFYLLTRDTDPVRVKSEVILVLERILSHEGEIFGKSAEECGNYKNLDLKLGQIEAERYLQILKTNGQTDFSYNGGNAS